MSELSDRPSESRLSTITSITNPLKFFALSLLIVEAMIGILAIKTESDEMLILGYLAVFMFVLVVMMVVLLAFKKPDSLLAKNPAELIHVLEEVVIKQKNLADLTEKKKKIISDAESLQKIVDEAQPAPVMLKRSLGD